MVLYYVYLAVASFSSVYVSTVGFMYVGEVCTTRIRDQYLKALLRQNIAYFDYLGAGEITTRITADTFLIQDGISEKFGLTLTSASTFISAFAIAFSRSWKLTFILLSTVVAIALSIGIGSSYMMKWSIQAQIRYAQSGSQAEEVLSSIRSVTAFNTQEKLSKQYNTYLREAGKFGRRHQGALGIMTGIMMFLIFLSYVRFLGCIC
jgi:ATP-binding cassette, subfamily B (MDR/TAP), member 1